RGLMRIPLHVEGRLAGPAPVLVVANHVSWLDIPVISAVAPVSFVAKKEVSTWPFISTLARLQRTVFIDRTRRTAVGQTTNEMIERDRKSTRLNSSHVKISYAVFCLKKKI